MRKPKYRLSPNEVERLVKEERERLRKLRIVQVREQAKANAALIRHQVKNEKDRLLADFANEVKQEVLAEKEEKIRKLEQKYYSTLRSIGEGHAEILLHGDGQKLAERLHKRLHDEEKAMERYTVAKEKHDRDKAQEEWEASRNIRNRNLALEVETQRAAYVASLPPPKSDEISFDDKPTHKKAIPMTDMTSFAATHYHIPDYQVVKAGPNEQLYDAKVDAEQVDKRLKQDLKDKKISHHEQVEKARIRGNEALHKEMLKHDLSDMMKDLSLLQRKDRRRRQNLVAEVPNQVFVPPERCLQDRADQQLEMERRFEEMYMDKQQKPDASTVQTWSELPTGDDTATNEESEMSTLKSVLLPPSEMALRDITATRATSQKFDRHRDPVFKNTDNVLKQLLNKIKEQKLNALAANQRQDAGGVLSVGKPGRDTDVASLTSASESRASWKRSTENVDEESQEDYYVKKQPNGFDADLKSEDSADTKSSGSKFLHENSALIGELQQRIQKIENQKLSLAQQLHSQSQFYQELQEQHQELQILRSIPLDTSRTPSHQHQEQHNYNDEREATLEDISLPSRAGSHPDLSDSNIQQAIPEDSKYSNPRGVHILPTAVGDDNTGQKVDLANAVLKLRPVAGILKGNTNPQFELLTSNGFLPQSLDGNVQGEKEDSDLLMESERSRNFLLQLDNINPVKEGGARRMIDFGGGDTRKTDELTENLNCRSDKSDQLVNIQLSTGADPKGCSEGQGTIDDPMRKKIQDYHLRAQELHASMDESTMNKVRDYQQHILQTHQDRKQLLENIRDDIERRRQALYTTSKFVGTGGAFLMNLGTEGSGDGCSSARGQISLPPKSLSMLSSSSYPMLSGFYSRPILSHSQSEKVLEPIKPFIADPWISIKKQQSILKPSSDFPAQCDLSKISVAVTQQGVKPPSSIERIKKSLAFDDLNESNVDESPIIYRAVGGDSLNDTSASRHSQAFTDDSKLTTSEEDRGSPILQGSRSDHWDTSDNKSNNSITGSSSLNGSALVAQAEQRREGFERRQQELRSQLMDIQHQKEAILMRYYKGQQAIQDQQTILRNKLLSPNQHSTNALAAAGQSTLRSDTSSSNVKGESWTTKFHTGGAGSDTGSSVGYDRLSGKSSGSGSLNLTRDEYLEEISYHQVKGVSEPTVPESALMSLGSHGQNSQKGHGERGVVTFADEERRFAKFDDADDDGDKEDTVLKETVSGGVGMSTWASLLSSKSHKPSSSSNLPMSFPSTLPIHSLDLGAGLELDSTGNPGVIARNVNEDLSDHVEAYDLPTLPSSQTPERHHHPHELSTILEVDTPTATNSVAGSSIRLAPPSASHSLQSLYSQGSVGSAHPYQYHFDLEVNGRSNIVVDSFPNLPQVLSVGRGPGGLTSSVGEAVMTHPTHQRRYNLATGGRISPWESLDHSGCMRGEGDGITLTEVSLGATSSCYTLESEPADVESNLDTSGGFNLSQSQ